MPAKLQEAPRLRELNLSDNQLAGPLSIYFTSLPTLERLDLSGNRLTGPFPRRMQHVPRLRVLDMANNQLTGALPAHLDYFTSLEELDLSGNELTGLFPLSLVFLRQLQRVDLGQGPWTGCLPPVWARDTVQVQGLDLPYCDEEADRAVLRAMITTYRDRDGGPWDLACAETALEPPLTARAAVLPRSCWGHPDVPLGLWPGLTTNETGRVVRLEIAKYHIRHFRPTTGTICPPDFGGAFPHLLLGLTALENLIVSGAGLTGTIPGEVGQLVHLTYLNLSDNHLAGPLPPELGRLDNLVLQR